MHTPPTHHVIRINRQAYPQVLNAVKQGDLQPTDEDLQVMDQGQVYRPTALLLTDQILVHDRLLQLGTLLIHSECHRLPEQEYTTLLTASHGVYRQYPAAHGLLTALLAPMTPEREAIWWERVRTAVEQGRALVHRVDLVDDIWTPTTWLRDRTRLIQQGAEWFLVLYFSQPQRRVQPIGRAVAGVDIGLHPLATAVVGKRPGVTYDVHWPTECPGDSPEVRAFAQILEYAAARAALEAFTLPLLTLTGTLVLERLDYAQFQGDFPDAARRHAVADWHMSWAPQRAFNRGIKVVRVSPAHTSTGCSQCRTYVEGTRQGRTFHCPYGHRLDAHANAARNLVRRYWGQRRRAQSRRTV
ncbi:transposase [Deinococcus sp. QL22]|uniref:transposase n=1 Tax=Deinococcus sp. QL22 TaxID=2939437 RepID=UPI00201712A5|nr:transposase [Deinococcus sp. QL22]UQN06513.1 transposase [Deinococcus sp. QL22]